MKFNLIHKESESEIQLYLPVIYDTASITHPNFVDTAAVLSKYKVKDFEIKHKVYVKHVITILSFFQIFVYNIFIV